MSANGHHREVPIAPLREAFERSGLTAGDVARRLGWMRPDHKRVQRQLGIAPTSRQSNSNPYYIESTSYARALELAEAIGVSPVEVDL
jgi:hypothetical protein